MKSGLVRISSRSILEPVSGSVLVPWFLVLVKELTIIPSCAAWSSTYLHYSHFQLVCWRQRMLYFTRQKHPGVRFWTCQSPG